MEEYIGKIKDIIDVWELEEADEKINIYIYKEDIEAMKKLINKEEAKTIEIPYRSYGKAHCPVCKIDIHGIGKIKYCFFCGQKINWDR